MADTKTDEERSRNMSAVRSRNTGPELLLRRTVWRLGLRYFTPAGWRKLTGRKLPGSPDLIFPRARLAVFVDGCFWHGCPLHYTEPADNRDFWQAKLARNRTRDHAVDGELRAMGWRPLRVWEHELRKGGVEQVAQVIQEHLRSIGQTDGD